MSSKADQARQCLADAQADPTLGGIAAAMVRLRALGVNVDDEADPDAAAVAGVGESLLMMADAVERRPA